MASSKSESRSESESESDSEIVYLCDICSKRVGHYICENCDQPVCNSCLSKCPQHRTDSDGRRVEVDPCNYKLCKKCEKNKTPCMHCGSRHCNVKDGFCTKCTNATCGTCKSIDLRGSMHDWKFECRKCCDIRLHILAKLCVKCTKIEKIAGHKYCSKCLEEVSCTNCENHKSSNNFIKSFGYCDTCFEIFEKCVICNRSITGSYCQNNNKGLSKCSDCVLTKRFRPKS